MREAIAGLLAVLAIAGCAGCGRRGPVDPKLADAIVARDWEDLLDEARDSDETDALVAEWLTVEAHRHLGDPDLAWDGFAKLREAQQEGPERLEPLETWARAFMAEHPDDAAAWELLSSALWWREAIGESESAAQKAVELAPNDPSVYMAAAQVARRAGRPEEAVQHTTRAIELDPSLERAHFTRAEAYADLNNWEEAIEDYSTAIRLNGRYARAYAGRGKVRLSQGDEQAALADLDKALELRPRLADAWLAKAQAHQALGHNVKAAKAYREFIKLAPDAGLDHLVPKAEEELQDLDV